MRDPDAPKPKRKVRDPNAPKPPSQVQRLKLKLEAKTMEYETEVWPPTRLCGGSYVRPRPRCPNIPHEREAVANEREVIISAQSSSISLNCR